jgi:hypothetical protein
MTGYFWLSPDIHVFGAFTPSLGSGLFHLSGGSSSLGIKLWSYGTGRDSTWAILSTARAEPYIEIQSGPVTDQSIRAELNPLETLVRTEFWYPVNQIPDIYVLTEPSPKMRDVSEIPLFSWARAETVNPWLDLEEAFKAKTPAPDPPVPENCCWAPSGMDQLDPAFNWIIRNSDEETADIWRFYYGSWKAGNGDTIQAIKILEECKYGLAMVLLARIYGVEGEFDKAAAILRSVKETWISLHPQVVVERDLILEKAGKQTLGERAYWLGRVSASDDEWIIERRVSWLIGSGKIEEARNLLLSKKFQKVHQDYSRTALWFKICDLLNEPRYPIPESLGEDRLAVFGAYREFDK